jgi:hypothetical protein
MPSLFWVLPSLGGLPVPPSGSLADRSASPDAVPGVEQETSGLARPTKPMRPGRHRTEQMSRRKARGLVRILTVYGSTTRPRNEEGTQRESLRNPLGIPKGVRASSLSERLRRIGAAEVPGCRDLLPRRQRVKFRSAGASNPDRGVRHPRIGNGRKRDPNYLRIPCARYGTLQAQNKEGS